jgi:hypothetical protein
MAVAGLRMPGALTVWLSDTGLDAWWAPATGRPGGQRTCSDVAIEAVLDAQVPKTPPFEGTITPWKWSTTETLSGKPSRSPPSNSR